jgi:tetratricopeptide (TPR) repeat protein
MAEIFVSYTSGDREWAAWIGQELEKLGHVPRIHEWEIPGGGDIPGWMEERLDAADHCLLVVSKAYLKADYSRWERRAAEWAAAKSRPNFVLPVFVEACDAPMLLAHRKRCDLHGLSEEHARAALTAFLKPPQKPTRPQPFPGSARAAPSPAATGSTPIAFPGNAYALSNIPFAVPLHFLGRDDALAAIETALKDKPGRVAITTLHGLRGVGKTVLAAAYADRHRGDYRATWWIRAQTDSTMRADFVALGIRLGWVGANDREEEALAVVMERLRHDGEGVLLIFDNAIDAKSLQPYLPLSGAAQVLVTSNAHDWRAVAEPIEISVWPANVGADFLIARTGRAGERAAAEALSEALGGLPLAHEQAAAYCERLGISFAEYQKRFDAAPVRLLDDTRHAPAEHNDGMTVAKSFALAIEEAAKLNSAAELLVVFAALLAPEPVPLFLFAEAAETVGRSFATAFAGDNLDEAVAALRTFALVDRELIVDERDASITTDSIRLHRLVREVAAARFGDDTRRQLQSALGTAMDAAYPEDAYNNSAVWPRCSLLTQHLLAICDSEVAHSDANMGGCANFLNRAAGYFHGRAAYSEARPLYERALAICEKVFGPEHSNTAHALQGLGLLLVNQGALVAARPLLERSLRIDEQAHGAESLSVAGDLNSLALLFHLQGDLAAAEPRFRRALAIREKELGPDHPSTARTLNNLALVIKDQGDLAAARSLLERTLEICEKALGPEHPDTAAALNSLAILLQAQGDLDAARPYFDRTLAISEKALGPYHPTTATALNNLAGLLQAQGNLAAAEPRYERALAICEKTLGQEHPLTATAFSNFGRLRQAQGNFAAARRLYERALAINEKALGAEHPDTINVRDKLSNLPSGNE